MSVGTKQIKARIKSVVSTSKVTKAMELVAGAKMKKAIESALQTREYSSLAWILASRLSKSKSIDPCDYLHNFFRVNENPVKHLVVVFSSNRGLCGAYNANVVRKTLEFIKDKNESDVEVVAVGKKAVSDLNVYGVMVKMAYEKQDLAPTAASIVNVGNYIYEEFKAKRVDSVQVVYTHYQSSLVQKAMIRQIFPFKGESIVGPETKEKKETDKMIDYIHEPSKRKVLSYLVPRLGELLLFQALLESNASEHSARMVAMKNATDAAGDMLANLNLQFNRLRQAGITQEISEISAGMSAVT